mgnify:FL=1
MSRKQYSKELKLELVKKHLPTKEHKGLKAEISFSFYGSQNLHKKISTHLLTVLTNSVIFLLEQEKSTAFPV